MNRIILVGNGFDLAHGLKTSYGSFIEWVCSSFIKNAVNSEDLYFENKVFKISCHQPKPSGNPVNSLRDAFLNYTNVNGLKGEELTLNDLIKMRGDKWLRIIRVSIEWEEKNLLFSDLLERRTTYKWVDIEEIYYKKLKEAAKISSEEQRLKTIDKLNRDLDIIKELLNEYLLLEENRLDIDSNDKLKNIIYSASNIDEFSNLDKIIKVIDDIKVDLLANSSNYSRDSIIKILEKRIWYISFISDLLSIEENEWRIFAEGNTIDQLHFRDINAGTLAFDKILKCLFLPSSMLFLNFNYTNTIEEYESNFGCNQHGISFAFETNHIHGTLNTENNIENMIFGYGDELSSNYKELEDLNENGVLENVKSIRYLDTNNYSNLIRFMDSDKYQIYIMGHSCGISDRTLLNTLFEHDNCVSIKPFYYQWVDNNGNQRDNYREIVQNISRNFGDKVKEYCQPLPQLETK